MRPTEAPCQPVRSPRRPPIHKPMSLSDAMQKELDRRLELAESEHANDADPAFVDLPPADRLWLLVLFVGCLLGTAILQAL